MKSKAAPAAEHWPAQLCRSLRFFLAFLKQISAMAAFNRDLLVWHNTHHRQHLGRFGPHNHVSLQADQSPGELVEGASRSARMLSPRSPWNFHTRIGPAACASRSWNSVGLSSSPSGLLPLPPWGNTTGCALRLALSRAAGQKTLVAQASGPVYVRHRVYSLPRPWSVSSISRTYAPCFLPAGDAG